jgi:membrane protease YdiL (CAAX protease family)
MSLRSAVWVFLAVLIGTAVIVIGVGEGVELQFRRFMAAVFGVGVLTVAAIVLSRRPFSAYANRFPPLPSLGASFALGVVLWLPVAWVLFLFDLLLTQAFGQLPPPPLLVSGITPIGAIVQYGIVFPLVQGLLFFGVIQRAANAFGRWRAIIVTAVLFALYAVIANTDYGLAAIAGFALLGVFAALATAFTGSMWGGTAVLAGYYVVRPLTEGTEFEQQLFTALNSDPDLIFGARWLLAVAVALFVAFVLIQLLRVIGAERRTAPETTPVKRLWWIPLIGSLLFIVFIGVGEFAERSQNPLRAPTSNTSPVQPPISVPPSMRPTSTPRP